MIKLTEDEINHIQCQLVKMKDIYEDSFNRTNNEFYLKQAEKNRKLVSKLEEMKRR